MIQQRRAIRNYNDMLMAFETSCNTITNNYTNEMTKLTQQSLSTLCHMFTSYLSKKQSSTQSSKNMNMSKPFSTQQSTIQQTNYNQSQVHDNNFQPTTYKKPKKSASAVKVNKSNQYNVKISQQISNINLNSESDSDHDQQDDEPTKKYPNFQELKNKDLCSMIEESQRKAIQKLEQNCEEADLFEIQDSEYEITDHSSNQSSNDNSYSPYFNEQVQNKPLFGTLFTKTSSMDSNSSSNLLNFSFTTKQLLKSPKKVPKSKRLYIGTKKIPRWAEDMAQIEKMCQQQKISGEDVFGKCVVENLDTNIIFQDKQEKLKRTSSAKWNNRMFLT